MPVPEGRLSGVEIQLSRGKAVMLVDGGDVFAGCWNFADMPAPALQGAKGYGIMA